MGRNLSQLKLLNCDRIVQLDTKTPQKKVMQISKLLCCGISFQGIINEALAGL